MSQNTGVYYDESNNTLVFACTHQGKIVHAALKQGMNIANLASIDINCKLELGLNKPSTRRVVDVCPFGVNTMVEQVASAAAWFRDHPKSTIDLCIVYGESNFGESSRENLCEALHDKQQFLALFKPLSVNPKQIIRYLISDTKGVPERSKLALARNQNNPLDTAVYKILNAILLTHDFNTFYRAALTAKLCISDQAQVSVDRFCQSACNNIVILHLAEAKKNTDADDCEKKPDFNDDDVLFGDNVMLMKRKTLLLYGSADSEDDSYRVGSSYECLGNDRNAPVGGYPSPRSLGNTVTESSLSQTGQHSLEEVRVAIEQDAKSSDAVSTNDVEKKICCPCGSIFTDRCSYFFQPKSLSQIRPNTAIELRPTPPHLSIQRN